MEQDHAEILSYLTSVLEAQNAEEQNQYAAPGRSARSPTPRAASGAASLPNQYAVPERIARAEAVVAYAESVARARVATVEKWATTSPLARAA